MAVDFGVWELGEGYADKEAKLQQFHVVAYDFGVKKNIENHFPDHYQIKDFVPY